MNLHLHLRELVARQGPGVVDGAEVFRAALDDFLTEDEATTGELNLLVDAVRLGAVHRLVSMVEHGAEPAAAVREAGDAFARDRGTDDVARCRWAVAVVGHSLGMVDEAVVQASGVPGFSTPAPPEPAPPAAPTSPPPAAPPPSPAPSTAAPARTFPETGAGPPAAAPPAAPPAGPPAGLPGLPPAPPAPPPRRGRTILIGLVVVAVVAAAVLAGVWLGSRDEDPEQAADEPRTSAPSGDEDGEETGGPDTDGDGGEAAQAGVPTNSVVLPIVDGNGDSRIYAVDVDTGAAEPLTDGPDHGLPVVSPDRSTVIYLEGTGEARRPILLEVESGDSRPLFGQHAACDYSRRPSFNPRGNRLLVECLTEFGDYTGMYLVNRRGTAEGPALIIDGGPLGSPTWVSDTEVVYAAKTDPSTLWRADVTPGEREAQQLTDDGSWASHPDWSDEAGLLLYSKHAGAEFFGDVLTFDADGEPGPSTSGELWAHPAWSPDGSRIAFTVRDDGTERLAVVPLNDLSAVEYVPDLPGEPGVPAWGSR